jgi:GTPase SAR1 family protein
VTTIPTIGFNVENIDHNNIAFTLWDVGGGDKIQLLWPHYLADKHGIIFVVDSSDHERLPEVEQKMHGLLNQTQVPIPTLPLLVFANKQDKPNAMNIDELTEKLHLNSLTNRSVSSRCVKIEIILNLSNLSVAHSTSNRN